MTVVQEKLTARERQILSLVAEGLGNKEIASLLNISVDTVKMALKQIYRKLGVGNRTAAAVCLIREV